MGSWQIKRDEALAFSISGGRRGAPFPADSPSTRRLHLDGTSRYHRGPISPPALNHALAGSRPPVPAEIPPSCRSGGADAAPEGLARPGEMTEAWSMRGSPDLQRLLSISIISPDGSTSFPGVDASLEPRAARGGHLAVCSTPIRRDLCSAAALTSSLATASERASRATTLPSATRSRARAAVRGDPRCAGGRRPMSATRSRDQRHRRTPISDRRGHFGFSDRRRTARTPRR